MSVWNQSQFVFPPQVIFRYIKILILAPHNIQYLVAIIELVTTIFYFMLALYTLLRVRASWGVLMLLTLLIPTFTGTLQGMPRYILHLFPAFIALSLVTNRLGKLFWGVVLLFLILQFFVTAFFTRGFFIA